MNFLRDIITYMRRIIKAPSNAVVSDALLIDYINRFWIMDVDARIQLFDLKTTYRFQTVPGVDQYNMPLYDVQIETATPDEQQIGMYPVYQGFLGPVYIDGVQVSFSTQKNSFFAAYPNFLQLMSAVAVGDGTEGPYTFQVPLLGQNDVPPNPPFNGMLRGHVDLTGIMALADNIDPPLADSVTAPFSIPAVPVTSVQPGFYITTQNPDGESMVITDSGQFLGGNVNYGLLMRPGRAPNGNTALGGGYSTSSNTINYFTGECSVLFPDPVPVGVNINAQGYFFQSGIPRSILYYNNCITLRSPPDQQYLVELDAYLSPAAFFNTDAAIPFGYMAEYIARGAARKYMSDVGDSEQMAFYEPLFKEQEMLVWKRAQRQFTSTRTQTIYAIPQTGSEYNNFYGGLS